jgi:hypothetical protein
VVETDINPRDVIDESIVVDLMAQNVWNIVHTVMNWDMIHSHMNLQKINGDLLSLTMIMICMMVITMMIKRKQI